MGRLRSWKSRKSSIQEGIKDLTKALETKCPKTVEREAEKERIGSRIRHITTNRHVGNADGEVMNAGGEVVVDLEGGNGSIEKVSSKQRGSWGTFK